MAGARSARLRSAGKLEIVDGGARDGDGLAELRRMLADAGVPEDSPTRSRTSASIWTCCVAG